MILIYLDEISIFTSVIANANEQSNKTIIKNYVIFKTFEIFNETTITHLACDHVVV